MISTARASAPVHLDPGAVERMRQAYDAAADGEAERPIYGRTTGVGANRDEAVTDSAKTDHALRLLRSHAGGTGQELPHGTVRAALLIRMNQLAAGGSGVHPRFAQALETALQTGAVPHVRSHGSIGTGDLSALADIALTLAGEIPWSSGAQDPIAVEPGDALAFISSSAVTLAESVLGRHAMQDLLNASHHVAALSFCALGGSPEAFSAHVHGRRPHPGAVSCATQMRRILWGEQPPGQGSMEPGATSGAADPGEQQPPAGRRLQDPFGLRAFPQVQGPALEAVDALERILDTDINAVMENPMIDAGSGEVYHHGHFSTAPLALSLDHARNSVHHVAQLSAARLSNLVEPRLTGLSPFLAAGPPGSSGVMILEYVAQDALAGLRQAAVPATLGVSTISRGLEDHASFAGQAARLAGVTVRSYRTLLACELLAAVRALALSKHELPDTPVREAYERTLRHIPLIEEDHRLTDEIARAEAVVDTLGGL